MNTIWISCFGYYDAISAALDQFTNNLFNIRIMHKIYYLDLVYFLMNILHFQEKVRRNGDKSYGLNWIRSFPMDLR